MKRGLTGFFPLISAVKRFILPALTCLAFVCSLFGASLVLDKRSTLIQQQKNLADTVAAVEHLRSDLGHLNEYKAIEAEFRLLKNVIGKIVEPMDACTMMRTTLAWDPEEAWLNLWAGRRGFRGLAGYARDEETITRMLRDLYGFEESRSLHASNLWLHVQPVPGGRVSWILSMQFEDD